MLGREVFEERRPSMSATDSLSLYAACADDGSDAQIDAFESLWGDLYRIAYAMLHDRPGGDALAADCAQAALIKVHRNLAQCRNPAAFREWAAQVVRRVVIDELRRPEHARRAALPEDDDYSPALAAPPTTLPSDDLRTLLLAAIEHGPLSERSRRVVMGRYFGEQPDEALARAESELAGQEVLPSHIQVTRAKNLSKLRGDSALVARLRELLEP
jgi:RNA polymerase sigma factor (sigma-70 family)